MAVLIPRIRTINVRLSEKEYLALERYCTASGARSISDLVRSIMHSVVSGGYQESALVLSTNENTAHMKDMEQKLEELAAELALLKAGMGPHGTATADEKKATAEMQPLVDEAPSSDSATVDQTLCETNP